MSDTDTTAPDDTQAAWQQALARHEDQPEQQDPPAEEAEAEAPSEETSAGTPEEDDSFTNFRIEDVPEEYRSHVEKAYKQLQGDYSRKTAAAAEERRQAENALTWFNALQSQESRADALLQMFDGDERAVLAALGYETDQEPEVPADTDPSQDEPLTRMQREWEEFKAQQQRQAEEAQAQAAREAEEAQLDRIDQSVSQQLEALAKEHGEISETEQKLIVGHALANLDPDENGLPQIKQAFEDLTGAWTAREKRWAKSKETTHVAPGGVAASQVPDLDNERDRRDVIADRIAAMDAANAGN